MKIVGCELYVADDPVEAGANLWWIEVAGHGRAWKLYIPGKAITGDATLIFSTSADGQFVRRVRRVGSANLDLGFLNGDAEICEIPDFVNMYH